MATDWKEQLIAALKAAPAAVDAASARAEALARTWLELERAFSESIRSVADGIGIGLDPWGRPEDGRVRWSHAGRQVSAYVDRGAGRCIVTVDFGKNLEMVSLTPNEAGVLLDESGATVSVEDVVERAVTRFFRGD